ncbi:MAG: TnsA endonuclease C-terminal domain-containing protein, partial [Nitrospiraceae bacterium]
APLTSQDVDRIAAALIPRILSRDTPINIAALQVDDLLRYEPGTSLSVVWHLMASRRIPVNLEQQIQSDEPLPW